MMDKDFTLLNRLKQMSRDFEALLKNHKTHLEGENRRLLFCHLGAVEAGLDDAIRLLREEVE